MGKAEGAIETYLRDEARKRGFLCWKFTTPSTNGVPDRILIGHGLIIWVETKAPNGRIRALQTEIHKLMRKHGAQVYVTSTRDEVDALLHTFDETKAFPTQ